MSALAAVQKVEIESQVRMLVADRLGVDVDDLVREVSLVDDLAADSLELAEIALAIGSTLGVALPARLLDGVRTCGELVDATLAELEPPREPWTAGITVRVRIVEAGAHPGWYLERTLPLSPYAVETIDEDVHRVGPGARVELMVPGATGEETLAWLEQHFAPLRRRGVDFSVHGSRAA